MNWGTPREQERRRRIMVAVAAYAYEFLDESIMPDSKFDKLCREIDLELTTRNPKMDKWFTEHFDPSTGLWVHKHPDKNGLDRIAKFILSRRNR